MKRPVKRPEDKQTVCPFVEPSIKNDRFFMTFHEEINGKSLETAERLVIDYIKIFQNIPVWDQQARQQVALLVVFPSLDDKHCSMLDTIHGDVKKEFVKNGLMLAQFHQKCDVRGIYNDGWRSQVSPIPFFAIRYMAFHDILFVGKDRDWFLEYNARFGSRYREPTKLEDFEQRLVPIYQEAKRRYTA